MLLMIIRIHIGEPDLQNIYIMNKKTVKNNYYKYKKVAVILRTKDRPLFLARAIEDIFNQTYQDFEIIIVNDSGDQNKLELVIKDYLNSGKVKVINNNKSEGFAKSSNVGIKNSESDFIVLHDDGRPDHQGGRRQQLISHPEHGPDGRNITVIDQIAPGENH